jgi:hypothetical protein
VGTLLRHITFSLYNRREFTTAEEIIEMSEALRLYDSRVLMLRILSNLGFKYKRCYNGKYGYIVASRWHSS